MQIWNDVFSHFPVHVVMKEEVWRCKKLSSLSVKDVYNQFSIWKPQDLSCKFLCWVGKRSREKTSDQPCPNGDPVKTYSTVGWVRTAVSQTRSPMGHVSLEREKTEIKRGTRSISLWVVRIPSHITVSLIVSPLEEGCSRIFLIGNRNTCVFYESMKRKLNRRLITKLHASVGVMKDQKVKLRDLHAGSCLL